MRRSFKVVHHGEQYGVVEIIIETVVMQQVAPVALCRLDLTRQLVTYLCLRQDRIPFADLVDVSIPGIRR
jgi:hypothetical protein